MVRHERSLSGTLERAIDVFVYLPIGLALELPRAVPRFIDRGRDELDRLGRSLGLARTGTPLNDPAAVSATAAPEPDRPAAPAVDTEIDAPSVPRPDASHLAIPDYDSLSASQVVRRLDGLPGDELVAVQAYEDATRGRRTILSKIAQLQAR